jgi:hypothetical protein
MDAMLDDNMQNYISELYKPDPRIVGKCTKDDVSRDRPHLIIKYQVTFFVSMRAP